MSTTWYGDVPPPEHLRHGVAGWCRIAARGLLLGGLVFGGLLVLLAVRLLERPVFGLKRPMTPFITVFVCRNALRIIGLRLHIEGALMKQAGAVVANHSSWLDIFVLNAVKRVYFVSKSEVARWPGIGWLARATGTVFISRERAKAKAQARLLQTRLEVGHRLLFFPEGTSSDGQRVLPFKSTLFSAFFEADLRPRMIVQPVSVHYRAPARHDARFFAWWGDMEFGPHLLSVLAAPRGGQVEVTYHPALRAEAFADRKALARACEHAVKRGFEGAAKTVPCT